MNKSIRALTGLIMAGLLAACANNASVARAHHCGILANPPAPNDAAKAVCPGNPGNPNNYEVILSAVFDSNGNPIGIGGGTDAGTGSNSDKRVSPKDRICWVATDNTGAPVDVNFEMIFAPSQNPVVNQNYQTLIVHRNYPTGLEFKYTVWTGSGSCEFYDPRFLIN